MAVSIGAILLGLVLLVWSADRFVDGAASAARHVGVSQLVIGMVIVGFGTSAPEMVVSVLAAAQGNPGIALGNAYGSNITNIALILGVTALISPMVVQPEILRKELPILSAVTALAAYQLWDGEISRVDAILLLVVFVCFMGWTIWRAAKSPPAILDGEDLTAQTSTSLPLSHALLWLFFGLLLLVGSSRALVWGATRIAQDMGVSDLLIGLTVVAIGTSLPELASSISAARKGAHDIALGNVLGSNLFNTLAVVGLAGVIRPFQAPPAVLERDVLVMAVFTLSLFVLGYGYKRVGQIGRGKGLLLLMGYVGYTAFLLHQMFFKGAELSTL